MDCAVPGKGGVFDGVALDSFDEMLERRRPCAFDFADRFRNHFSIVVRTVLQGFVVRLIVNVQRV